MRRASGVGARSGFQSGLRGKVLGQLDEVVLGAARHARLSFPTAPAGSVGGRVAFGARSRRDRRRRPAGGSSSGRRRGRGAGRGSPRAISTRALHRGRHARQQALDHVRTDRVIEHRRRAHLHRAAAEQEVVERVRELGDAADAGKRLVRKRLRQLRHLRQRQRQNRRTAEAADRHQPVDVHLELERLGIDERQRRECIRRSDRVGAAEKRAPRLDDDVGRRRRQLGPDRHARHFFHRLRDDGDELLILADVRAHVLAGPCAGRTGSARAHRRLRPDTPSPASASAPAPRRCPSRP